MSFQVESIVLPLPSLCPRIYCPQRSCLYKVSFLKISPNYTHSVSLGLTVIAAEMAVIVLPF